MTIQDIQTIVERADVATKQSPIAVFATPDGLDCIFANTAKGVQRMAKDMSLIDVFAGTHPLKEAREILLNGKARCDELKKARDQKEARAARKKAKMEAAEAAFEALENHQ